MAGVPVGPGGRSGMANDAQPDLETLRRKVGDFEQLLLAAFDQKYHQLIHTPPQAFDMLRRFSPAYSWPLEMFLDSYLRGRIYPQDRLERVMYLLFDLKLQLYYITEVDLGLYNRLVFDRGYDESRDNLTERPHVVLTYLSLHQNMISKSRILWERVMNLVYFLETGMELDHKAGKRSKRGVFRSFLEEHSRWAFLESIAAHADHFDASYRTPELHKASILRASLLGQKRIDPNAMHSLIDPIQQVLWPNLLSLVAGGPTVRWVQFKQNPNGSYYPAFGDRPPFEWPEWPTD